MPVPILGDLSTPPSGGDAEDFAFIEVAVEDCVASNPDPTTIIFTHHHQQQQNKALCDGSSRQSMIPPSDSSSSLSSLSGSCSTDDMDPNAPTPVTSLTTSLAVRDAQTSSVVSRSTAVRESLAKGTSSSPSSTVVISSTVCRASKYAVPNDELTPTAKEESTHPIPVSNEQHGSHNLVSVDDLPVSGGDGDEGVSNRSDPSPFERAPLDAPKLTVEDRRGLSIDIQRAKEETATLKRCAELLSSEAPLDNKLPAATAQKFDDLVAPDQHYRLSSVPFQLSSEGTSLPITTTNSGETLPIGELLDTSRFAKGVPAAVRDDCKDALVAVLAAYSRK